MNHYADGLGIAALVALLIMAVVTLVVAVLLWLSWKWSRPGASFWALAFPLVLPLAAMLLNGGRTSLFTITWGGVWTVIAVGIWGRAIWLRPGEDDSPSSVRRRTRDIVLSAALVAILYGGWVKWSLADEERHRKFMAAVQQQDVEDRAKRTQEWNEGRITTSAVQLCYSRDKRFLAAVGQDLEIWDLTTGKLHHRYPIEARKSHSNLQFDSSETHLAMQVGHEVKVYDIGRKQGPMTLLAGPEKWLNFDNHITFLDGEDTIVVLQDGKAHAFHVETGQSLPVSMAALQQPKIQAFAISEDKQWQATWSSDQTIAVWRSGADAPIWTVGKIEARRLPDLQFSSDGHWLALTTQQGAIVVWNVATGVEQQRFDLRDNNYHTAFRFSDDGQRLVAVQKNLHEPCVCIWDITTGRLEVDRQIPITAISELVLDHTGSEFVASVLPATDYDRQFLKQTLQRFDTAMGAELRGFRPIE